MTRWKHGSVSSATSVETVGKIIRKTPKKIIKFFDKLLGIKSNKKVQNLEKLNNFITVN